MADKIKFSLHDLKSVNTVLGMLYDANGNYRPGFKPEEFYNTILLDTLKYGEENFVHLKYAETVNIRKGEKVARFRRWAGMTPTIRPMIEGLPPAPDKHAYEYMEVGNVFSFGRWSEYTDQIDMSHISEIVAERSVQYGENANQTKELYARKTWLSSPNEYFASFKDGFDKLCFGDAITIDDLRFLTARMKRMQVKPLGGKFNYICSPEFINGLIDDPRVKMYMEINQTTGNLWTSGECFPLFDLNFIPTMLDEFAYPDVEFPGVYETSDGHEVIRLYAFYHNTTDGKDYIYYMDVRDDFTVKSSGSVKARKVAAGVSYLSDGTAVENLVEWEFPTDADTLSGHVSASTASASNVKVTKSEISRTPGDHGVIKTTFGTPADATSDTTILDGLVDGGKFMQLPVHRGILFGDEAMIKLNYEGLSDAPRIIIKPLGSSGVLDPLDQRQSVGYRVDGFGLAIKRPEAICVTYGIPANAEFAALTAAYVMGGNAEYKSGVLDYTENGANEWTTDAAGNHVQTMVVDAVNNPYEQSIATALVDAYTKYQPLAPKEYAEGALVQYKGVPYRVKEDIEFTAWESAGVYTVGTFLTNSSKLYKVTTATEATDTTFPTTKVSEITGPAAFYSAVKTKLEKDADNLFKNLLVAANDSESNIK